MCSLVLKAISAALLTIASIGHASESQIVCNEVAARFVDPRNLESRALSERVRYRFARQKLYITPATGPEYLYNTATMAEPGRIVSGHKIVLISETGLVESRATFIHAYRDEVRISSADCQRRPLP
jgi:hypothetical protein